MRVVFITLLPFLLFPILAHGAGFTNRSLFLSKSSVTEGETVFIHAVVSNDSYTEFSGKLEFSAGDTIIDSVAVELDVQDAEAVSVSWNPSAGRHTVRVVLIDSAGTAVETESAVFTIAPKPTEEENGVVAESGIESSEQIQQSLAKLSPAVAGASAPLFSAIDSLRTSAVAVLEKGKAWTNQSGENTNEDEGGIVSMVSSLLSTGLYYVFSILSYLVRNAALFYPLLAVGFIYGLWRLYKRMREPRF